MRQPVYFVRHGQSQWNVAELTQGQTPHPPLTDLGLEQAHRAAALISADLARLGQRAQQVISSDLLRAEQTAGVIAEHLDLPVRLDQRLREQHLGWLEGRPYQETWAAAAEFDWDDPEAPIAGGESLLDVSRRMAELVADLDSDLVSIVVSHGDAIRSVLGHLEGFSPLTAPWVEVPNGSVVRYDGRFTWLDAP